MKKYRWIVGAVGAAALFLGACATTPEPGDLPEVSLDVEEETYISPDASPGVQDTLRVPTQVSTPEGTVVQRYEFQIFDEAGAVVFGKAEDVEEAVVVPELFVWDGKTNAGLPVPDGEYTYKLEVWDSADRRAESGIYRVIVDNTPPQAEVSLEYDVFSPDGNGARDNLVVMHDASVEQSWTGTVVTAGGDPVAEIELPGELPERYEWNGKNEAGDRIGEGTYRYRVSTTDRAGNSFESDPVEFSVDLTPPRGRVTSVSFSVFSPNGDGNKEQVTISQRTSTDATWHGAILNQAGRAVREYTWEGRAPEEITWDGTDEAGNQVPDGVYRYRLYASDEAGNSFEDLSSSFTKDSRPVPPVRVTTSYSYFSPNDDGVKDEVEFLPSLPVTEGVESYSFFVKDQGGEEVWSREEETDEVPESITWDGTDNRGDPVPNGRYTGEIEVVYENGNRPTETTDPVYVNRDPPKIRLSSNYTAFSPDGDGRQDTITIFQDSSEAETWEGEILDSAGDVVRTYTWTGEAENLTWDGTTEEGEAAPDGRYTYRVTGTDRAGNTTTARLEDIRLSTRETRIGISAASSGFSPNGDGRQDELELGLSVKVEEGVTSWNVSIIRRSNEREVKSFSGGDGSDIPSSVSWDGRTDGGDRAPEGRYHARFVVEYRAGHKPEARTESDFVLDVTAPEVIVSAAPKPFSPDGDGEDDEVKIDVDADDASRIEGWSVQILDPRGNDFIEFSGSGEMEEPIVWDGRSRDGELVQAASDYTAAATVTDAYGNRATARTEIPVDVFIVWEDGKRKIKISSIHFVANKADYRNLEQEKVRQNMQTLDRLAEILKRFSGYHIEIEGYAVREYWRWPKRAEWEQENELLPLSKDRAEAIKQALVERGIDGGRVSAVGYGGEDPVVPHGDLENRWKNRRVEFVLTKK